MHLCHNISLSAHAPLCKTSRKKVNNLSTKKEVYQSKVACVSYMNLRKKMNSIANRLLSVTPG